MKKFLILFEGTGYDLYTEDDKKIGGFFVSVLVEAAELEEAIDLAYKKLVTSDKYLALITAKEHPNGVLSLSEYTEVLEGDPIIQGAEVSGFVFYPEEEDPIQHWEESGEM